LPLPLRKILFVIPSYSHKLIDKHTLPSKVVPYGVLSLASYIKQNCPGTECRVIDFNAESQDMEVQLTLLKSSMLEFQPDMVGLSVMYNACKDYVAPFAEVIKLTAPDAMLTVGGIMATNLPEDVFSASPLVDAICFGEGEIPLRDLLNSENPDSVLREHPSWLLPDSIKNGKHPAHSLVVDLDEIPPIDYSLINVRNYHSRINSKTGTDGFTLPIHSTRGCPFDCIFCCSAANHGRKVRSMSAACFLSDVELMVRDYGITKLSIDDDQFLFYRDRAIEILTGLEKFGLELEMANGLTVRFIDDEIAALLKKAGLKIAVLAIESGSPRVLSEIIGKPLDLRQVRPAVEALRKQNLAIHTFFIIGFPGETTEDRQLTRAHILETGYDWNGIYIATPYKGSRLFDLCREKGYIQENSSSELNIYECQITAPGIDPAAITREAYLLNLDVNFVNNYNLSHGHESKAAEYFAGVARRYPTHAFAHYFLAKAMESIPGSNPDAIKEHYGRFKEITVSDKEWMNHAVHFKIL